MAITKDLTSPIHSDNREKLAQWFARFSSQAITSPMYHWLAECISRDDELLNMLMVAPMTQPVPNLFLAAVHFLVLSDRNQSLAKYYPSCGGKFEPSEGLFRDFREFCLFRKADIIPLLLTKFVQTNEVRRCGAIRLGVSQIAKWAQSENISLVEVGASAGLNLLFDQYPLKYSRDESDVSQSDSFQIMTELRGADCNDHINRKFRIQRRLGVDLNPLNLGKPDDALWLKALVWPDQLERLNLLNQATEILKRNPPELHRGSGLDFDLLKTLVDHVAADGAVCILHSFTLNQFTAEQRVEFENICVRLSVSQPIWRVGFEWIGSDTPQVAAISYQNGKREFDRVLAHSHDHGRWVEWLV